jgi:hypothetical protein
MSTSLSLEQSLAALVSLSLEQALRCAPTNDPARVSAPSRQPSNSSNVSTGGKSTKWHTITVFAVRCLPAVRNRPDLVAAACQAFPEHAANSHPKDQQHQQHSNRNNDAAAEVLAGTCHWVWTTVQLVEHTTPCCGRSWLPGSEL